MSDIEVTKILNVVTRIRNAKTFQDKMNIIAEGIALCGWRVVHLYVVDRDRKSIKSAAYIGIDKEGIEYLESHRMPIEEIEIVLNHPEVQKYKLGPFYYITHDAREGVLKPLIGPGLQVIEKQKEPNGWHPRDIFLIPLYGFGKKLIGLASVDDPVDGKKPTLESIKPLEAFTQCTATYIEESEYESYFHRSRSLMSQIFSLSPIAIIITDENEKIIQINPAAEQIFGYKLTEIENRHWKILVPSNDTFQKINAKMKSEQECFKGDILMTKKDGSEFWGYMVSVPAKIPGELIEGYLFLISDITELKNLQYYLIRAEKMAGIGVLASGIAHELNNPLYGILGLAETIVDENNIETIKSYASNIIDYTKEAAEIVKSLSEYSYSARTQASSTVNPNTAIQNAIKMIRQVGKMEKIEIIEDYGNLPEINASRSELQQVFVNLITNSVDAMPDGGILSIRTRTLSNFVEIKISDTGIGIPEEYRTHLFEPFFTTKPVGEGTGLGLYITYRIVTKYNGTIEFESEKDKGTTFIIKFPVEN